MGYEAALQRVSELRAMAGIDPQGSSTASAAAATPGAFQAQLAQQQAALLMAGGSGQPGAAAGLNAEAPLSQFGLPVLTVADQYRMMGIGGTPGMPGAVGGGGVGQRMVALAQREMGVSETSGNNESPRIREYRSATAGAQNTPGPWCAYFVSWLAKSAGAPIGAGGNGTGYVPTLEAWGRQENRWIERGQQIPQPGDIVIFDWGGDGTPDHTGIVESVDSNGTVNTIEGNSSDRVRRRSYAASSNDIRGFVRPG